MTAPSAGRSSSIPHPAAPRRVRIERCSIGRQIRAKEEGPQMKGLKTLIATVATGTALLAMAPASASAAAYSHYVACGVSQNAKPSHLCQKGRKKGAFFRSNSATVFYTVCVKFPTKKNL